MPTLAILAPTLLDFGTEEQKQRYMPPLIRGEEIWVQFLSEPTGGSDLAGLVTRATRDGDVFLLNGSKIWSSGAYRADYALCLARTNWQVPKHRGLTMFIVKIHQPAIEVQQIKMVNGVNEFCQEFFDNVAAAGLENVLGQVDDGWTVATRLLFHERDAVGGGSPYTSGIGPGSRQAPEGRPDRPGQATGQGRQPPRPPAGGRVPGRDGRPAPAHRPGHPGLESGYFPGRPGRCPGSTPRSTRSARPTSASRSPAPGAGPGPAGTTAGLYGQRFLFRQGGSLGGGSNEMQRNIISERVLGMPREYAADRDKPFEEVRHNTMPTRRC